MGTLAKQAKLVDRSTGFRNKWILALAYTIVEEQRMRRLGRDDVDDHRNTHTGEITGLYEWWNCQHRPSQWHQAPR